MRIIARNKRANFDYDIKKKFVAGIVLKGFEVKAAKTKGMDLNASYISFRRNEAYLINAKISPYQSLNTPKDYLLDRERKILLRKKEISQLLGRKKTEKLTVIPLKAFIKDNLIKIEIALAKSRKKYDKREKIRKREEKRRIAREMKESRR